MLLFLHRLLIYIFNDIPDMKDISHMDDSLIFMISLLYHAVILRATRGPIPRAERLL